jgi:site-specific DNA-methyltransferase (adenine-specific)
MPEDIVDLTITSPPYNVEKAYDTHDDSKPYWDYISWLEEVFVELYRVHKDHSFIAVNIGRNTGWNTPAHISTALENAGFKFYKSIVWVKPKGAAHITAWYRHPCPRYYEPYLITEDILIYTKGEVKGEFRGPQTDEFRADKDFIDEVSTNIWEMMPESHKSRIHPAPFPFALPGRLVRLLSHPGDVVYDPFAGTGTTLIAARDLGRKYIGSEISDDYYKYAEEDLKGAGMMAYLNGGIEHDD